MPHVIYLFELFLQVPTVSTLRDFPTDTSNPLSDSPLNSPSMMPSRSLILIPTKLPSRRPSLSPSQSPSSAPSNTQTDLPLLHYRIFSISLNNTLELNLSTPSASLIVSPLSPPSVGSRSFLEPNQVPFNFTIGLPSASPSPIMSSEPYPMASPSSSPSLSPYVSPSTSQSINSTSPYTTPSYSPSMSPTQCQSRTSRSPSSLPALSPSS
jgi:hypothetical protein